MFPARAGMSRAAKMASYGRVNVPRASGDEPVSLPKAFGCFTCSPRERG